MGFGAGFGQTGGATGVGSATTQTGNQPLASTGGKGGGYGVPQQAQNPYASMQQPQQPQQYRPFGGDAFGYNMARLSRQMDPSATLPQQNYPPTIYTQPGFIDYGYGAPQTGGKGGGMGGYGAPQFFNPMYGPNPFIPQQAAPTTPTAAPAPTYDDSALRQQITELQNQLAGRTPAPTPATSTATPNTVQGLYQQYLGRAPESAEVAQYWNQRFGQTIDPNEVEEFVRAANQERKTRGMGNVPGFDLGEIDYGIADRTKLDLKPEGASADAPAPAPASTTTRPNIGGPFTSFVDAANAVGSPPPPPPPPATSRTITAPPPPPGSSAGDIAYRNQIADLYAQNLGRAPSEEEMALVANTFGSEISDAERAQFSAAAEREKAGGRKKGGAIKAKPKTKIQHKGMTNNLKKMLKNK